MTLFFLAFLMVASFSDGDQPSKKSLSAMDRKEVAERVCAAAKQAVADNDVARGDIVVSSGQTSFEEINRLGVVLIGFRLGVAQVADRMVIYALEPIYLTSRGEIFGAKRGRERPAIQKRNKGAAAVVEILRAKPGYAVGAIRLQLGVVLEGVKLVFMRIDGDKLDVNDKYESKWVGTVRDDRTRTYDGAGHLIIGVRGVEIGKELLQVGPIFAGKDAPSKAIVDDGIGKAKGMDLAPKAPLSKPDGMFKKENSSKGETAVGSNNRGPGSARSSDASKRNKEPTTRGVDLTSRQPLWKWEERFSRARIGDFAQYDYPEEHLTRTQEVIEVGEHFVVIRERVMPINDQKIIVMRFDDSTAKRPASPEAENISVTIQGKDIACKRYIYPAAPGKKGMQEVYSEEVPFDGLVGRQSEKGAVHLRRFSRGPE
jgi:hypothetical protein